MAGHSREDGAICLVGATSGVVFSVGVQNWAQSRQHFSQVGMILIDTVDWSSLTSG
jgi:hypothetical protein